MAQISKKNAAQLEALCSEHGNEIAWVEVAGELYAFRCPTIEEFEAYQTRLGTEKVKGVCFRELCQLCCLTDLDKLKTLFKVRSAFATRMADKLTDMAGLDIEITVGKD